MVGLGSGKQYAVMGDNPQGPEQLQDMGNGAMQVIPPADSAPKRPVIGAPGGGVSMQTGGMLDFDPFTRNKRAQLLDSQMKADEDIGIQQQALGQFPQRRAYLGLQRAQQAQESQIATRRRAALVGSIQEATNVAEQSRKAQLEQARGSTDYRYTAAGVAKPVEVEQATGDTSQVTSPYARTKLMTTGEQMARDEKNTQAVENIDMQLGRDRVESARLGLEESDLDIKRQTLSNQVQQAMRGRARLGGEEDELPPFPGGQWYTNPDGTGEWLTPGEADQRKYDEQFDLQAQRFPREAQRSVEQSRQRDILQRQQYGLGGLTPSEALTQINKGTLASTGLTEEQVYRALQQQGYSPKAAFAMVTNANPKAKEEDAYGDFNESDFAHYLWGAVGRELRERSAKVEAYLIKTYGETAARVKMQRYLEAAAALQKAKDKAALSGGYVILQTPQTP